MYVLNCSLKEGGEMGTNVTKRESLRSGRDSTEQLIVEELWRQC